MKKYPFLRVIVSFLFAPPVGGAILGAAMILPGCHEAYSFPYAEMDIFGFLWFFHLWIFLTALTAMVYQFVPALILAFICITMRPKKGLLSYVCITACGAFLTSFWVYITNFDSYHAMMAASPFVKNLPFVCFFLGGLCTFLVATFVFPNQVDWSRVNSSEEND